MGVSPTILWFRLDLRLADNPALQAALRRGGPILPVFVWAPEEEGGWAPGGASRWWLHQSLRSLANSLENLGSRLILRRGPTCETLVAVARETRADAVVWNRRYEPALVRRDTEVKARLKAAGLTVESYNSALLCEPWTLATRVGKPYQVFTPFWKACQASASPPPPAPAPRRLPAPVKWPPSLELAELKLEPTIDWAGGLRSSWQPGERGAQALLDRFLRAALADYRNERDRPDRMGTSRLSPHLHFGEIGPGQIWHALREAARDAGAQREAAAEWYLRELGWREFAHHLLFHFPHTTDEPLRQEFTRFPWRSDAKALRAWQRGRTGYPLVDAGMRELWHTGWMHNRVRMVVASFLVKHLLIPWQEGAAWFWDTLVDADLANNSLGWQWTAGCGADAAPFFRIFNPVSQGSKFDEQGEYVRRWVPELARVPAQWIHQPWAAPPQVLAEAEVKLGVTYPLPIVEHAEARKRALEALSEVSR